MATAKAASRQAVLYETESSWGEDTQTFGTRLQSLNRIDTTGLTLGKERIPITRQYMHEAIEDVVTFYGGSFTVELLLTGHGGATTGSLTETDLTALLGNVIGAKDAASEGTTADGTGTASAFGVNGGTFADGSLARLGAHGDGRGEGQALLVDGLSGGTLTVFNEPSSVPNAGDAVYAMQVVHPNEDSDSVTSTRWLILSANKQFECHGCFPTAVAFTDIFGGVPKVQVTFQVSWWRLVNNTFPDTTSTDAKTGAPTTRGSFMYQDHGTTTRSTLTLRDLSLEVPLNIQAIRGHGGVDGNQIVVDAVRVPPQDGPRMTVTIDAEATGTNTLYDDYTGGTTKQALYTASIEDGKSVVVGLRKCKLVSPVPTQRDMEGLNRVQVVLEGMTDTAGGSEMDRSAFLLGMG